MSQFRSRRELINTLGQRQFVEELHLDPAQARAAKQISERARRRPNDFGMANLNALATSDVAEIAALLKPEQMMRLREITLQVRGVEGFDDPLVRDALEMTTEQRIKADALWERTTKRYKTELDPLVRDPSKVQLAAGRLIELQKEAMVEMFAMLTTEQKHTYRAMRGMPMGPAADRRGEYSWLPEDND